MIQFFNKNDPYFNSNSSCHFVFNMQYFPINVVYEVDFNTLSRKNIKQLINLSDNLMKNIIMDYTYTVQPQDFKTFIFITMQK